MDRYIIGGSVHYTGASNMVPQDL